MTATGTDIYDRNQTRREVLILSSDLHPGDSGAALIDPTGEVVGVAFAIAPDRAGVAYALAMEELEAVLHGDLTTRSTPAPACSSEELGRRRATTITRAPRVAMATTRLRAPMRSTVELTIGIP